LIVENGIIGFALFFYWLSACLRYCPAKWYLIGLFCVSMFTLDTYLAYKIMAFLLFVAGYYASGKNVWEPARHDRAALAALISPNKIVAADQQARAF
ncbi:MAG TPA: hypothetical protein VKQ29_05960, partial [Aliidongia sp.]|nr:hypothetical protein [Aliidongia sp.]